DAAGGGQAVELVAEDELVGRAAPVDEGHRPRRFVELLEQRPQRGDPDAGGDQRDAPAAAGLTRQAAVGALDQDPGSRLEAGEAGAAVAQVLDGDPQAVPAGGGRQRVGVPPGPAGPVEETEDEVLAGPDREPLEGVTAEMDGDDA